MVSLGVRREAFDELPEVEVFVPGPDGEPMVFPEPPGTHDRLRDLGVSLGESLDHLRDVHAASGKRLGDPTERATRDGSREDVVAPLLVDPVLATAAVMDGALFAAPVPHVDVDEDSLEVDSRGVSWQVSVRVGRRARRAGTLRLYSSPSANITVLELVPERPRWVWSWAFVRCGVIALDELGERLRQWALASGGGAGFTFAGTGNSPSQ